MRRCHERNIPRRENRNVAASGLYVRTQNHIGIRTLSLQQQQEQLPPDFEQVMGPIVARWKSEQNS